MSIGIPGIVFLSIALIGIPWLAVRSRLDLSQLEAMPRTQSYRMIITQQLVMLVVALLIGWLESLPLSGGRGDAIAGAVAGGVLIAAVLLLRPLWRRKAASNEPGILFLAPRTAAERRWWMVVSLVVGISEEVFWRGVAVGLLIAVTGNPWIAVAIAAAAFGLAHAAQGKDGIAVAAVLAMVLGAMVIWTGGLYMAIALHVIYDVVAGFDYGRMQKTENG